MKQNKGRMDNLGFAAAGGFKSLKQWRERDGTREVKVG